MSANMYKWFFDSLIAEMLIVSAFLFYIILRDAFMRKTGRLAKWPIFSGLALFALAVTFITIFYGSFIEPEIITVNRQTAELGPEAEPPIKIALISDLHAGYYVKEGFIGRVVEKIEKENPDIVLIAGDLIDTESSETKYLAPLTELAKKFPTYAVLGNHESGDGDADENFFSIPEKAETVTDFLTASGIKVFKNTGEEIGIHGRKIYLGGTLEYLTKSADVAAAFADASEDDKKILLAHNPDIIYEAMKNHVNLVLAAHTHGGQIRLPIYGPVGNSLLKIGNHFDEGWFNFGDTKLFITSGLGEAGTRARLFNPPEIVILNVY